MTMPLSALLNQASAITADSRKVAAGSVFLAYPGEHSDGRQYIVQAIAKGATGVLWEANGFTWDGTWQLPNVAIADLRNQSGYIADEFYGHPSQKLWMIGVTGTNGKTSCSHWLAQALELLGRKAAVVGTLGNGFPNALSHAINTTPDPILLHGMLADYLAQGAQSVAMEVSSHGLEQGRVNGVHFNVAVFTNLTRDHLDYHGDMASYAAAKRKLFDWDGLSCSVLNTDDDFGLKLASELQQQGKQVLTYGLDSGDVRGLDLEFNVQGLSMQVHTPFGDAKLQANVLGRFNAYNLLAVLASLLASDIALEDAIDAVGQVKSVAGRMQQYGGGEQPLVVIDYAHTPDALEKVLKALREQASGRLICVFGCGGNRDAGKRPLMAGVASNLADKTIVTSDNPRHENPAEIIRQVLAGMHGEYEVAEDRTLAIKTAIQSAQPQDVVLVAGKGHEDYQEIAGVRYPFSDAEVVQNVLKEWLS